MSPAKKASSGRSGASSKAKSTPKKTAVKKIAAVGSGAKKVVKKAVEKTAGAAKKTAAKTPAKKTPLKKTAAKKPVPKKTAAKKAVPKKTAARGAKGSVAKKTPAKAPAKKTSAKTTAAKKTPAKKTTAAGKTAGKKVPATEPKGASGGRPERKVASKPITRPAPAPPPKKKVRPAKFTPQQLAKIKQNLEAKRVELEGRQKELDEASFDSTQSDITGEVGIDEDFADAGTATFERERDLSIRNNIRDLIDQVTRAARRIEDGTYGTCERCGQPIDAVRLRELPHASLCLDCKRREERAR